MEKTQKLNVLLLCLMFSLFFAAIPAESSEKQSKVVFVLFDISDSTRDGTVRQGYLKDFQAILDKINPGDVIVADRINEESVASSTLPVKEEFQKLSMLDSGPLKEKVLREKQNKSKKEIIKTVEDILKQKVKVRSTDILSSLQIAESVFKSFKRDKNVLVLMSDMVEESNDYNFKKDKLSSKRTSEIIGKEKSADRIPDLKNAKVYAVRGAIKEDKGKYNEVKRFWLMYFKEAGATLATENYGSSLINFNE